MSLEAVLERDRTDPVIDGLDAVVTKTAKGVGKTAGFLWDTAKHAIHAANPVRDAYGFGYSLYHLIKDKKQWKEYKKGLKKGKFLGKGNLANVAFTTGIVASGMYPALLALRAGIGAGAYVGKRAITTDAVRRPLARFCDRHKKKASWIGKNLFGIDRAKTEQYFSERNVKTGIDWLRNDKFYRKKVLPAVLDAAIAAKGYAGLVGAKWLAGTIGKGSDKLVKNSKSRLVRKIAKYTSKIGDFGKNFSSDALSTLVFAAGAGHMYQTGGIEKIFNGEYYNDAKESVKYVASGDAVKDTANYFSQGRYGDDIAVAVSGTAASIANWVGENFSSVADSAAEAVKDPVAAVINPEDKYAVIIAGYDIEHNGIGEPCERFVSEQCQVYHDLLDMGYKPENIRVLMPEGLDVVHPDSHFPEGFQELKKAYADTSYCHEATEANLEQVLKDMGKKVDGNDTFVFYMGSHGNRNFNWQTGDCNSYVGLNNGTEVLDDHELVDYVKGINGQTEFYFVDACHSAGFADQAEGKDGIWVAACRKDQPAVMHMNGDSLGTYLVEELKQKGGIDNDTSYGKVKGCLRTALDKFRESWKGNSIMGYIWAQDQKPVVANNSSYHECKKRWI